MANSRWIMGLPPFGALYHILSMKYSTPGGVLYSLEVIYWREKKQIYPLQTPEGVALQRVLGQDQAKGQGRQAAGGKVRLKQFHHDSLLDS